MRRVVVTGLGVVSPNGIGKEAFWSACVNGHSGVGPIRAFDASSHPVRVAAEVPEFDLSPFVPGGGGAGPGAAPAAGGVAPVRRSARRVRAGRGGGGAGAGGDGTGEAARG